MKCPRCSDTLKHEIYEGLQTDRCPQCKGTWLDEGEIVTILDTKEEKFSAHLIEEAINTAFTGVPQDEQRSIEKCPKCSRAMQAVNYGYDSGIVIDRCPDAHGVWLDGKEIEKIQAHREHWEKESKENRQEWIALVRSVEGARKEQADETRRKEMRPTRYIVNSVIRKIFRF